MNVLIACECSGVVREAFRARGHNAWSCDLKPSDDASPFHIQGDALDAIALGAINQRSHERGPWDLMIAHPPCTYLNSAGLHWNARGRGFDKTEQALKFVAELLNCRIERIALENPIGCISTRIHKPDQIVQPYQFGEDASKATCLWLRNLPKLKATVFVAPRLICACGKSFSYDSPEKAGCPSCGSENSLAKKRWANQTDSGQNRLGPSPERSAMRSKTYNGIAQAMAEQWGNLS